jgi:hypothetical protein
MNPGNFFSAQTINLSSNEDRFLQKSESCHQVMITDSSDNPQLEKALRLAGPQRRPDQWPRRGRLDHRRGQCERGLSNEKSTELKQAF